MSGPRFGPPSFWQADVPVPTWPALDRKETDVLVLGAGLAGLGVARALAARGRDVLVLDAKGPGAGASGRNAGFVLRAHVTAFPSLRARVGDPIARALLTLGERTHRTIGGLHDVGHRRGGSVMLACDASEASALDDARRALVELGVRAEEAPVPSSLRGFESAVALPEDGEVHPMRVCATLAHGLEGQRATVTEIDLAAHRVLAGHELRYRTLVLATNAWTSALLPSLVVSPHRAQMLATSPLPHRLERPCYARLGFDYFRQLPDGRVLVGGQRDRFAKHEATDVMEPTPDVQAALERLLHDHLPFAAGATIERRWAGTMGFTPSALPYVGRVSDDVYACLGFTGHGLGIALGCAALCATEVSGDPWPADLAALRGALAPAHAEIGSPAGLA